MIPARHRPTLLIASNNAGKLQEYTTLLSRLPVRLTSPRQEGLNLEVTEGGATFEENAVIKARSFCDASGLPTLADDSGLEVDALGGRPGILSARYAGAGASDTDRYCKLLMVMADIPWEERRARFRCVIALARPYGTMFTTEGICEGVIAFDPRGEEGFGYDPVFFLPALGVTMAQLAPEAKDRLSHRARAAMRIMPTLYRHLLGAP